MRRHRPLHDGWVLRCQSGGRPGLPAVVPAAVPGCVHTDLLTARLIPDPYLDVNEIVSDWVGRAAWRYELAFEWEGRDEQTDLVCAGLDTAATLVLNGTELGRTSNMHRSWRFDVRALLQPGSNRLAIDFEPASAYGERVRTAMGAAADLPQNYPGPWTVLRKMACNFGWDWGPTLVTAGIWQPIGLDSWQTARLLSVRPHVTLDGADGLARVLVDVQRAGDAPLRVRATVDGVQAEAEVAGTEAALECRVPDPRLWWPHDLGDPALHDLTVELLAGGEGEAGEVLDRWTRRIGFRSVRLDTTADEAGGDETGSAFTLVVNEVPVFVRGANWIPDDCFPSRVTPERYRRRVAQAREANVDLLRVWGGGLYETDAFYEACDAAGILVWQDFPFACAAYPEDEPVRGEVEAEARENIVRLLPHPSLVLWNGNNENIWGFFDWGWKEPLDGRAWGAGYYLDLLPRLVGELDPGRPYWPGSPYSGSMGIPPNADEHGCKHIWDVWNEIGYDAYRRYVPRFCSEFGWQAPPNWATLRAAAREDAPGPATPGVLHHQKATNGNDKLLRGLQGHFPPPRDFDGWHFVTQLNQARAIALGVEHMRSHRPRCMGTIVWQLNDCWPVTSWAAIDGAGRRKPLWYALRRCYADHLLTIQPRPGKDGTAGLAVVAVNDRALFWREALTVERIGFDGRVRASHTWWRVLADRFTATTVPLPDALITPGDGACEFLRARMGEAEATWFFRPDEALHYPPPLMDATVEPVENGVAVSITARSFLRDLCLLPDRIVPDAAVDDMLATLLPGESRRFVVSVPTSPDRGQLDPAAFARLDGYARTANHVAQ